VKAVIMAGGEGRRLRAVSGDTPKPMVPLLGRPMLEHILILLKEQGFDVVSMSLRYKADEIMRRFGDGSDMGLKISIVMLLIGIVDYIYQKFKFKNDMKMTKQEVKDEYKNSEGDPKVKAQQRSRMRQAALRRMMKSVPTADVVITNPTHFAVAIKYEQGKARAPIVVAKGEDFLAAKIKDVAKEHNVTIVENKPLARMLYYNVDIDQEIPPELYQAVAEVLAFVYKLKNKQV